MPSMNSVLVRFLRYSPIVASLAGGGLLVLGQANPPTGKPTTPEDYRQAAMTRDGEVARGRTLFADEKRLACSKCHSLDGLGLRAGPDLAAVGDRFARRELIDAVLQPSATIAVGYSTTLVTTKSGEEYQGVLKLATDSAVELMIADGQKIRIATSDIREQRGSNISLMPEGLQTGLTPAEFTDLIEYLVSLKQPDHALSHIHGMPENIPALNPPAVLRPLLDAELKVASAPAGTPGAATTGLVWMGQVPGFPDRFLVAHQAGVIWRVEKSAGHADKTLFADFTPEVFSARGPNGLLGIAFHPQFAQNRKYYVKQQVMEVGKITTLLLERQVTADFARDSGQPPRRLMTIPSVAEHHNGGCIQFGPDGFLYLGMGDSAPNFDPQGSAQDLRRLFGKMLRIDVDHPAADLPYGIPSDNPFLGRTDARPEIWAYGLREPWRFSFDSLTGDLWVADLGQERGDEIDLVRRGENYGWNVYEGFELFSQTHRRDGAEYVAPLFATRRKHGSAVIGGHVYRGDVHSSFYGVYIFGDYQSKRVWGLTHDQRSLKEIRQLATSPQAITCIANDAAGNLYVVGYAGMIYQLDLSGARFDPAAATK